MVPPAAAFTTAGAQFRIGAFTGRKSHRVGRIRNRAVLPAARRVRSRRAAAAALCFAAALAPGSAGRAQGGGEEFTANLAATEWIPAGATWKFLRGLAEP